MLGWITNSRTMRRGSRELRSKSHSLSKSHRLHSKGYSNKHKRMGPRTIEDRRLPEVEVTKIEEKIIIREMIGSSRISMVILVISSKPPQISTIDQNISLRIHTISKERKEKMPMSQEEVEVVKIEILEEEARVKANINQEGGKDHMVATEGVKMEDTRGVVTKEAQEVSTNRKVEAEDTMITIRERA